MGIWGANKLTPGRQWATKPFNLIETPRKGAGKTDCKNESGAFEAANEMSLVHNFLIRGLNSIYLQAPNVKEEKDIADFLTYMYSWALTVHMHHENEEEVCFPLLDEMVGIPGHMDKNVDQHKLFGPGLKAMEEYIPAVREGREKFSGQKVRDIIDSFGEILTMHLTEEIQTLLDLEKFADKIDWPLWNKKVQEKAIAKGDMEHEFPYAMVNMDITYEESRHVASWPPFPWYVGTMIRWLHYPKHKGAWRFGCCDPHGYPKDLPFV